MYPVYFERLYLNQIDQEHLIRTLVVSLFIQHFALPSLFEACFLETRISTQEARPREQRNGLEGKVNT